MFWQIFEAADGHRSHRLSFALDNIDDTGKSRVPELSAAGTFRFLRSTGPSELFERSTGDEFEGPGLRGESSTRLDTVTRGFGAVAIGSEIADEVARVFAPLVRTAADKLSGMSESSLLEALSRIDRALLPEDRLSRGSGSESESEADSSFGSTFTATVP